MGATAFPSEGKSGWKGSPFKGGLAPPLKGMIPPSSASLGVEHARRRGECRFSRAKVTFAETRLSSCTGKGGGSIAYGRLVSADAEGRKLAVWGSRNRLFLWRRASRGYARLCSGKVVARVLSAYSLHR